MAIKLIENFSDHKYTLVRVIRELQVLEHLTQLQEEDGVPSLFTKVLDTFAPKNQIKSSNMKSLFVVMELKEKTLLSVLEKNQIELD